MICSSSKSRHGSRASFFLPQLTARSTTCTVRRSAGRRDSDRSKKESLKTISWFYFWTDLDLILGCFVLQPYEEAHEQSVRQFSDRFLAIEELIQDKQKPTYPFRDFHPITVFFGCFKTLATPNKLGKKIMERLIPQLIIPNTKGLLRTSLLRKEILGCDIF